MRAWAGVWRVAPLTKSGILYRPITSSIGTLLTRSAMIIEVGHIFPVKYFLNGWALLNPQIRRNANLVPKKTVFVYLGHGIILSSGRFDFLLEPVFG